LGHANDGAVTAGIADQRETNPGIAGGALDDDAARAQQPALFGVFDDVEGGAVLDRAAGVEELGLAEDRAPRLLGGPPQLYQRRLSDRADKAVANLHTSLRIERAPRRQYRRRNSGRNAIVARSDAIPSGGQTLGLSLSALLHGPDSLHDPFRCQRRRIELNAERRQRVADGVGDRRRRRNGAAFAAAFDTEWVE